jgi:DNA-binding LacI/PurR family transcriptional regulator
MIGSLELARLCGVSQGTVDRALHDRPGISAATRERILAMAARHGYHPNPAAHEIMSGSSRLVGALVPAINSLFFMDLMHAIQEALAADGLRLLVAPVGSAGEFQELLAEFAARRMRAAIVVPPDDDLELPRHASRQMKVVSLLTPARAAPNSVFLAPDEAATGREAVRHLAGFGHRRIAHLSFTRRSPAIRERERGFAEAMRGLLPAEEPLILRSPGREDLLACLERQRPTALFCHNDPQALWASRILAESGRRVPQDVSVLGVDRSPAFLALQPDLSSLEYPRRDIAARTADWIAGRPLPAEPLLCRMVPGATVAAPRTQG